jgi:hypothetical protein
MGDFGKISGAFRARKSTCQSCSTLCPNSKHKLRFKLFCLPPRVCVIYPGHYLRTQFHHVSRLVALREGWGYDMENVLVHESPKVQFTIHSSGQRQRKSRSEQGTSHQTRTEKPERDKMGQLNGLVVFRCRRSGTCRHTHALEGQVQTATAQSLLSVRA